MDQCWKSKTKDKFINPKKISYYLFKKEKNIKGNNNLKKPSSPKKGNSPSRVNNPSKGNSLSNSTNKNNISTLNKENIQKNNSNEKQFKFCSNKNKILNYWNNIYKNLKML